jgi:hypothetical protein
VSTDAFGLAAGIAAEVAAVFVWARAPAAASARVRPARPAIAERILIFLVIFRKARGWGDEIRTFVQNPSYD